MHKDMIRELEGVCIANINIISQANSMPFLRTDVPDGWTPAKSFNKLEEAIPFKWDDLYADEFGQLFQPVRYLTNAVALSRFIKRCEDPSERSRARAIVNALIERAQDHCEWDRETGACFVVHKHAFVQAGLTLAPNWVSAISNAFVAIANMRLIQSNHRSDLVETTQGLMDAYKVIHRPNDAIDRWIALVHDDFLWFEEYPRPDGTGCLVLNGHIYALHALNLAHRLWPERQYLPLLQAGLTTVRENAHRFRRECNSNIYSLLGERKSDYAPLRTVRQQCELFALTQDQQFKTMAGIFYADIYHLYDESQLKAAFQHCDYPMRWSSTPASAQVRAEALPEAAAGTEEG